MSLVEFVQTLCEPCFPPHYNIVNRYIAMYHSNISQHVSIECLRHLRHHQQSFLLHLRITRLHIVCCTVQMCVCACVCVCTPLLASEEDLCTDSSFVARELIPLYLRASKGYNPVELAYDKPTCMPPVLVVGPTTTQHSPFLLQLNPWVLNEFTCGGMTRLYGLNECGDGWPAKGHWSLY